MKVIKNLQLNREVIFDSGRFDEWCVYIVEKNGNKRAPFDTEYFSDLKNISVRYPANKVYDDFVKIYQQTSDVIDPCVVELIDRIADTYVEENKCLVEQWFAVIYGGMIAEENKKNAVLKKRVKRLGMHQVLKLNFEPHVAANFSKGKRWRELDAIMKKLGF